MKKISCLFIILMYGCTMAQNEPPAIQVQVSQPVEEEEQAKDEQTELTEVEVLEVQPIAIYDHYSYGLDNGRLFGLNAGIPPVELNLYDTNDNELDIEAFNMAGVSIYYTTTVYENDELVEYNFQQTGGVVQEVVSIPPAVIPERIQAVIPPFEIYDYIWNGIDISRVVQHISETSNPVCAFISINAYLLTSEGLWFTTGYYPNTRPSGLHFWPIGSGRIQDYGQYGEQFLF